MLKQIMRKGLAALLIAAAVLFAAVPASTVQAAEPTAEQVKAVIDAVAALDPAAPQCHVVLDFGGGNQYIIGPEMAMTMMRTNADGSYTINQQTNYYELDVQKVFDFLSALDVMFPKTSKDVSFTTTSGRTKKLRNSGVNLKMNRNEEALYIMNAIMTSANEVHQPTYGLGDTYIEIDLAAQKAYMYQNYQRVWESSIVSGNVSSGNSTPEGVYALNGNKARNTVLTGANYASRVSYWMPFIRNSIGLHDATWRRSFGGNIYKSSGSHGCINLPLGNAKALYSIAGVGTPVIVIN